MDLGVGEAGSFEVPRGPTEGRSRLASSGRVRAGTEGVGPPKPWPTGSMAPADPRSQASAPRPAGVRLRADAMGPGVSLHHPGLTPSHLPCFPPPPTRLLPQQGNFWHLPLAQQADSGICCSSLGPFCPAGNWGLRVEIDDLKRSSSAPFLPGRQQAHALSHSITIHRNL